MLQIPACLLGTAQSEHSKVVGEILEGKYKLVYMTPELCCGDYGKGNLKYFNAIGIHANTKHRAYLSTL